MKVNDTIVASPKGAPVQPVVPLPASVVSDVAATGKRGKGQDTRQGPGTSSRFRAVLDAATFNGLAQSTSDTKVADTAAAPQAASRTPPQSIEISGEESEQLYRASRAFSATSSSSSSEVEEDDTADFQPPSPAVSRQALAASRRYAESFFAVDRTYAARGESLELSA